MEITEVKVFPVNEEKLKAYVTIVLDHCFVILKSLMALRVYSLRCRAKRERMAHTRMWPTPSISRLG